MAIFMEYEGLKGNVTAAGYEGMIALDFFSFGLRRAVDMTTGAMTNREVGKPAFSVLTTGKQMDASSAGIMREAVSGSAGKRVVVHFVSTGNNGLHEFLTYTFHRCLPTFYQIVDNESETSPAAERLCLSYAAVEVASTQRGADNKAGATLRQGYNLAATTGM